MIFSLPPQTSTDKSELPSGGYAALKFGFSPNLCRLDNVLRDEISQKLLPSAIDTLSDITNVDILSTSSALAFQMLQTNLAAAKRMHTLEADLKSSQCAEEEIKKKLSELSQEKLILEEKAAFATLTIEKLREDIKTKSNRIKSLEEYGRRKRQEVIDAAGFYTWQTKKDIMASFMAGEAS
ncbi:unnamed protein product [Cuscuta europaea]|uniref:Uncharacterized protein n=1 Tax=Cuscuta europaea TaxID=41803 RepID=A0A9P0ZU23_CUSEU|nr:unnamed protein product [Cuscuta europaea]